MASPFTTNLGYAVLTVFVSFIVLSLVVSHPELHHESTFIELPDGRHVSYLRRGSPSASNAILYLHGMLSCRHESAAISDDLLQELDAFIVAPDRAGYGESSVTHGRDLETNTEDLVTVLDALNIQKVFLVGTSGGGPHAFAFAAKYPEKVRGILSLSAACESGLFHADRIQGSERPPDPRIFSVYRYLRKHPWLTYTLQSLSEYYTVGRGMYSLFLEGVAKHALAGFTEADRRCVVVTMKSSYLIKVIPGALQQAIATPVIQDLVSVMMPPPVNFSSIPKELQEVTQLWHGDYDPQVNSVCLDDYQKMLPLAKARRVENGGHFAYWACRKDLQQEAFRNLITKGLKR